MRLEDIDLDGLGAFEADRGAFRVDSYHLEEPWPFIYASSEVLLRVDQHGPDYLQFGPPSGVVLFKRERFQQYPPLLIWVCPEDGPTFTCFNAPVSGGEDPLRGSQGFSCTYSPERALFRVERDGLVCETSLFLGGCEPAVVMSFAITNAGRAARRIRLVPAMLPHFAEFSLQPWDVPSLYQRVSFSTMQAQHGPFHVFDLELRSPAGLPEQRQYCAVLTDLADPNGVELDYEHFVGRGAFHEPEALLVSEWAIPGGKCFARGEISPLNSVNGRQAVLSMKRRVELEPGQSAAFSMVFGRSASGGPMSDEAICSIASLLRTERQQEVLGERKSVLSGLTSARTIRTPDVAFDRYVNEFLPLQLSWVRLLDRGWPTGMRGVRDCAQDTTALVPLDAPECRRTLLDLCSVQRSDGWFPRQYSIDPAKGRHDLRAYVDGGVWVWELLHDYLCWSKGWSLLDERVPYLDSADPQPVLQHMLRNIGYYTDPHNLGEHGLCLIREGDWNDSVNRAGLDGRGESVMVSCQAVLMLKQAAALLDHLSGQGSAHLGSVKNLNADADKFRAAAELMREAILRHALNDEGYLNGVFTDRGEWVFSARDPDGARRINIPVNAFGIISGVLRDEQAARALAHMKAMKRQDGWPLFHPPIGDPPISGLGRIGQGDLSPGLGENGAMYNHGCHGFLGRAAAAAGDGELLYEVLRYMLPYDQSCHPVSRSKTAPYGVVNHWKTAPGEEGRGGALFLTGSISTALRNTYDGLFGIRPFFDALGLDPTFPSQWDESDVSFSYCGANVRVCYRRRGPGKAVTRITAGGAAVEYRVSDPATGAEVPAIPDSLFQPGRLVEIVCEVG